MWNRRKNLTPYEIDIALAKRKRIYEEVYPETVHGIAGGLASGKSRSKGTALSSATVPGDSTDSTDEIISPKSETEEIQPPEIRDEKGRFQELEKLSKEELVKRFKRSNFEFLF